MFAADVMPWECGEHEPVEHHGLGRVWTYCGRCGFLTDPHDRDLLQRLLRSVS